MASISFKRLKGGKMSKREEKPAEKVIRKAVVYALSDGTICSDKKEALEFNQDFDRSYGRSRQNRQRR